MRADTVAGSLSVPWPLPQRQLGQGDQHVATWDPPGAQILLCSSSLICSSQEAAPGCIVLVKPSRGAG